MRNVRLDLCYDGTRYRGWQRLPNTDNTIQAKLETALSRILQEQIRLNGSGRTDAGTHARMQVANFHCGSNMSCEAILSDLRRYLPEDIGIYSCRDVSERFHARLNAKRKKYCYRLWNSGKPCVFERRFVYTRQCEPDIDCMQRAASMFLGTHDFSAFCANKKMTKSTVRTIYSFEVIKKEDEICFVVEGNGFLQHMVRIMVGTVLEVGLGERSADSISILFGEKRQDAGQTLPACGLCLMEVLY